MSKQPDIYETVIKELNKSMLKNLDLDYDAMAKKYQKELQANIDEIVKCFIEDSDSMFEMVHEVFWDSKVQAAIKKQLTDALLKGLK